MKTAEGLKDKKEGFATIIITASRNFLGEDYSYLIYGNDDIGVINMKPGETCEFELPNKKCRLSVSIKQHPTYRNMIIGQPNEVNKFIIGPGTAGVSVSKIA